LFSELRYVEIGRESRIAVNVEEVLLFYWFAHEDLRIELHKLLSYKQVQYCAFQKLRGCPNSPQGAKPEETNNEEAISTDLPGTSKGRSHRASSDFDGIRRRPGAPSKDEYFQRSFYHHSVAPFGGAGLGNLSG